MSDTQPLGTATAERTPEVPDQRPADSGPGTAPRTPLRQRRLGWWPVLAVAVTAVVVGALLGFGLGRVTDGGGNGGPGGFGGPGRGGPGQFPGGFPGQQGQQGQQFGGPQGQQGQQFGGQPGQPAQ